MKGTVQGDFSRLLFDRRKHYSAVHLQQGRVQLDSDWNAQINLARYRQETETVDVVGLDGAPAGAAGFGIEMESCLALGPSRHFVAIGGSEGCAWSEAPLAEAGFTIEIQLVARGEGVLFSRWVRHETGFKQVDLLSFEDGRLRFARVGQPDLLSEPVDLLERECRVALAHRVDVTTIYLDGAPVVEEASGFRGQSLEKNNFLLAATIHDNRPDRQLEGLFFGFRLWQGRRTTAEIEAPWRAISLSDPALLGSWPFAEDAGSRIRDHSVNCNHGEVKGEGAPVWLPRRTVVTAGRYYAGGLLCENDQTVAFDQQPDNPGVVLPAEKGSYLFYLDAWEREISAIEDPDLREIALGGPDTTTRSRTVAQVKTLRVGSAEEGVSDPATFPEWRRHLHRSRHPGRMRARCRPFAGAVLGNDLYRVEIHHAGGCLGGRRPVDGDGSTAALLADDGRQLQLEVWPDDYVVGRPIEIWLGDPSREAGEWALITEADAEQRTLRLDRELTARGDVELRRLATYKWSRENASLDYPIVRLTPGGRAVKLGPTARGLGDLCAGDWVEVVDDFAVLRREVGPLCQLAAVESSQNEVTLEQDPPDRVGTEPEQHPLLRQWDQRSGSGLELLPSGVLLVRAGWQDIEEGIQLFFEGDGVNHSGDYWWLPSRQLAQDIEWPRGDDDEPLALPPFGVEHHFAPLALLAYSDGGFHLTDLRRTFQPMVSGSVSKLGDTMDGDLAVRTDVEVHGDLEVRGQARIGEIYGRLCGPDMVDTPQVCDSALTLRKLAPEVGVVPAGFSILGAASTPPPGYASTGSRLTLFPDDPQWVDRLEVSGAGDGPYASAEIEGRIFTLLESGDLWEVDPAAGTWRRRSDLPARRRRFALAALAGKLHVVGGVDASERCCGGHWVYDPANDGWREAEEMPTARCDLAVAVFGGQLHAFGGLRDIPLLGSVLGRYATTRHEVYDPRTESWFAKRPLTAARSGLAAANTGSAIHVVGGERRWLLRLWGRVRSHDHQLYHPGSDRWLADRSPLPSARRNLALVTVGGRLYAVGGQGASGWLADCDRYDPGVDHWTAQTPLHESIESPGVAAADGALYAVGARRAPGAHGVLVEECRVATVYHVHQRSEPGGEGLSVVPEAPAEAFPDYQVDELDLL